MSDTTQPLLTIDDILDALDTLFENGADESTKVLIMQPNGKAMPIVEIGGFDIRFTGGEVEPCVVLVPYGSPGRRELVERDQDDAISRLAADLENGTIH